MQSKLVHVSLCICLRCNYANFLINSLSIIFLDQVRDTRISVFFALQPNPVICTFSIVKAAFWDPY